ncbi:uncharacterized protein K02A2.6 [Trichonephila clavipes]|nr:uncharacterized protein K02A2.6 [Trichonephila clavipes]
MIASLSKGSEDADKNSLDMWWHSLKPQTLQKKVILSWPLDSSSFFATGGWASHLLAEGQITPHSLTGETPSALFLKRCIRTRLDLLKPNLRDKVVQKQSSRLDTESILREFQEGEKVAVRNYSGPNKWKIGTIINRDGTLSYSIQIGNEIWKRHVDQIRKCGKSIELSQAATEIPIYDKELNFPDEPVSDDVAESEPPAPEVVPKPKEVPVPATPSDDIPPKPVPDASGKPKTDVPLRPNQETSKETRPVTLYFVGEELLCIWQQPDQRTFQAVTRACFVYFFVFLIVHVRCNCCSAG